MSTLSLSIFVDVNHPANFTTKHSTSKIDSIKKSVFQRIGLAYKEADLIAYRITDNPYAAKSRLVADLLSMGLNKDQAEVLLSAKDWELRMKLVWGFMSSVERKRARGLDYSEFENYWPELSFADPKWVSQAKGSHIAA